MAEPGRRGDEGTRLRVPPHSIEAEESLLGAMLLSEQAVSAVAEMVSPEDFYKPAHRHIYDAVQSLYAANQGIDPVTVAEELASADVLETVGGPAVLVTLQARTPAITNAEHYARIVAEKALLRRLIATANDVAELGYSPLDDIEKTIDSAESLIYAVAQRRNSDTLAELSPLLGVTLEELERRYEAGEGVTGTPTGYTDLDNMLSGLQPGALIVLGARPAMGKCLAWDTPIVDPVTGAVRTMAEQHALGRAGRSTPVLSLGTDLRLVVNEPSAHVDDGRKPVVRVTTALGRTIRCTWTHPFRTIEGWRPLLDLAVGERIAVPRSLPVFGDRRWDDHEVSLLGLLLGDGCLTDQRSGAGSVRFTGTDPVVVAEVERCADAFGVALRSAGRPGEFRLSSRGRGGPGCNPVIEWTRRLGIAGCDAHTTFVPAEAFELPRRHVALLLNRLFATDGWASVQAAGPAQVGFASVSEQLARDVQHLLLRLGIVAALRERWVRHDGSRRRAFQLTVTHRPSLLAFADEVGILGKEAALGAVVTAVQGRRNDSPGSDVVPSAVWPAVDAARSGRSWGEVARGVAALRGLPAPAGSSLHVGRRDIGRDRLGSFAAVLADAGLEALATSDVWWDRIVSIEPDGVDQVYDLTVPGDHNFVAADIVVHNTAFALGVAAHAAVRERLPVLFCSLEMSHLELTQRLIAAEARIDSTKLRTGRLAENDWSKITKAIGRLGEGKLWIDDNPALTLMEIRAKARRLQDRLDEPLGLIVIDYLQLMQGRSNAENRQVEVAEISRGLKVLARELRTPVVALSQLSRQLELRADKRPMLADLRESGCLTADTRVLRADTGAEVTIGELARSGARDVPVWTLGESWRMVPSVLTHAFPTGVRTVHRLRLASGREVTATDNHPFRTVDGWVALGDLGPGDRIAVPRRIGAPDAVRSLLPGRAAELAADAVAGGALPAEVHALADADLAAVLAEVLGRIGSLGVGTLRGRPLVRLNATSRHRRLLCDLQLLLTRFEVQARITDVSAGRRPRWRLWVHGTEQQRRLLERVGIAGPRGGSVAAALDALDGTAGNPNVDTIPCGVRDLVVSELAEAGMTQRQLADALGERWCGGYLLGTPTRPRNMSRERLGRIAAAIESKELSALAESDVLWDEVVEVVEVGCEEVFDATVVGTHNFVADGIVVHNSIEQDADVVMFLYRDEVYHPETADKDTAEVIVAKHRAGRTGISRLVFLDYCTMFANMAKGD